MQNNSAFREVIALMNAQQWNQAEFKLGHLFLAFPNHPSVLAAFSEISYYRQDMSRCLLYYGKALEALNITSNFHDCLYVSKMAHYIGHTLEAMDCLQSYTNKIQMLSDQECIALGHHYLKLDAVQHALQAFNLVDNKSKSPYDEVMHALSVLYTGNIDAAKSMLLSVLGKVPGYPPAAQRLAMLGEQSGRAERIALYQNQLPSTDLISEALLKFAIFFELDADGQTSNAFDALASGNASRKRVSGHSHEIETSAATNFIRQLELFDFSDISKEFAEVSDAVPIFVCGLPRTGTTLLEKQLSALADIKPVGEHMTFRKGIELQTGKVLASLYELGSCDLSKLLNTTALGQFYRKHGEWRAGTYNYYTDKEPTNYMFCGFIAAALPDARIIHIRRNPMDACFSMYKQYFAPGSFEASYSLIDLATHYRNYSKVMDFWRKVLGSRMLEINYEELVLNPAKTMLQIETYCKFESPSVVFPKQESVYKISTLSAAQVMQPIHAGNINAWAKYAEQLKPLREALDEEYVAYMRLIEGVQIL